MTAHSRATGLPDLAGDRLHCTPFAFSGWVLTLPSFLYRAAYLKFALRLMVHISMLVCTVPSHTGGGYYSPRLLQVIQPSAFARFLVVPRCFSSPLPLLHSKPALPAAGTAASVFAFAFVFPPVDGGVCV
jgi:hypothetical protein